MDSILFLSAPLIERIWGSNYFKDELNRTDKDTLYGEMWSVSALSEASSIILNGTYKDKTLKEVYENNPSLFNPLSTVCNIVSRIVFIYSSKSSHSLM